MFATLIFGILAGIGVPYAEPKVKDLLEGVLTTDTPIEGAELRVFTFAVLLVLAAIVSMIFGSGQALPLAIGAAAGTFGPRALDRYRNAKTPDYDS